MVKYIMAAEPKHIYVKCYVIHNIIILTQLLYNTMF